MSLSLVQSTTPGRVFRNLIILGSATNEEYSSGPGDIRAYDVLTGRLVWSFHTIPHPGDPGYDDARQRFIVRNSWGTGWGKAGYFTMPYQYLLERNLSSDFWTMRLVEDPSQA